MQWTKNVIFLLAATVAVGCGNNSATSAKISEADAAGWKTAETAGEGVSVQVPKAWDVKDFSTGDLTAATDAMFKDNPALGSMAAQIKQMVATGKFKMFVMDMERAAKGEFPDSINVLVDKVPAGATVSQLVEVNKATLKAMAKGVDPIVTNPKLPGGEAYRMESSMEMPDTKGGIYKTYTVAYLFFHDGLITCVTFGTLQERKGEMEALFNKMAESIKLK